MNDSQRSAPFARPARTPLPGWKAILIREETFAQLQAVQRANVDPYLDLRYLGDAAVSLAGQGLGGPVIMRRAIMDISERTKGGDL